MTRLAPPPQTSSSMITQQLTRRSPNRDSEESGEEEAAGGRHPPNFLELFRLLGAMAPRARSGTVRQGRAPVHRRVDVRSTLTHLVWSRLPSAERDQTPSWRGKLPGAGMFGHRRCMPSRRRGPDGSGAPIAKQDPVFG